MRRTHRNGLTAISVMRTEMFKLNAQLAKRVSGPELVMILKDVSEEVYMAGIDGALAKAAGKDLDDIADAYDLTWLTALALRLHIRSLKSQKS